MSYDILFKNKFNRIWSRGSNEPEVKNLENAKKLTPLAFSKKEIKKIKSAKARVDAGKGSDSDKKALKDFYEKVGLLEELVTTNNKKAIAIASVLQKQGLITLKKPGLVSVSKSSGDEIIGREEILGYDEILGEGRTMGEEEMALACEGAAEHDAIVRSGFNSHTRYI